MQSHHVKSLVYVVKAYASWPHMFCRVKRKLTDRDVCKMFIVGMCPYEEFERTKHDVGPCPLIHDEELQAEWKVAACASGQLYSSSHWKKVRGSGQFLFCLLSCAVRQSCLSTHVLSA